MTFPPADSTSDPDDDKPGLKRRTVIGAAARSVPLIAVSVATPAAAASAGDGTIVLTTSPDTLSTNESLQIVGTLVPAAGRSVPAGHPVTIAVSPAGTLQATDTVRNVSSSNQFVFELTRATPDNTGVVDVVFSAPGFVPTTHRITVTNPGDGVIVLTSAPDTLGGDYDLLISGKLVPAPGSNVPSGHPVTITLTPTGVLNAVTVTLQVDSSNQFSFHLTRARSDSSGIVDAVFSATGFTSATHRITVERPSPPIEPGVLSITTGGTTFNKIRNLPIVNARATFTAKLTRRNGAPMTGKVITFTSPGTLAYFETGSYATGTFATARTVTGMTNNAGELTVRLTAPVTNGSAVRRVTAAGEGTTAAQDFVTQGGNKSASFVVKSSVSVTSEWVFLSADNPDEDLSTSYLLLTPNYVTSGNDQWRGNDNGVMNPGVLFGVASNGTIRWTNKDGGLALDRTVPAGTTWTFPYRSTHGSSIPVRLERRIRQANGQSVLAETFTFNL